MNAIHAMNTQNAMNAQNTIRLFVSLLPLLLLLPLATAAQAAVVSFEELTVPAAGYFNGDPSNLSPGGEVTQPWTSGGLSFSNTFGIDADYAFPYWFGFAYSDVVNTTTNTFENQYAAFPGSGHQSTTYGVAYADGATIALPSVSNVAGMRIANTTYTFLTMRDGDSYGFTSPLAAGGWFLVTASGSLGGTSTGTAEFYLADLRGGSPPGIVSGWEWFDLSGLGAVDTVSFTFTGSDVGSFGLNTPAYFALDDLTFSASVPEPGTWALLASGGVAGLTTAAQRRRGRRWLGMRRATPLAANAFEAPAAALPG
jgi:hypothetical protein